MERHLDIRASMKAAVPELTEQQLAALAAIGSEIAADARSVGAERAARDLISVAERTARNCEGQLAANIGTRIDQENAGFLLHVARTYLKRARKQV